MKEEWVTSFSGGMQDSAAATAYRNNESALLLNYRVTPDGQAEVRHGSRRTHTTALNSGAQGYGGIEFRLADGTVQWVVFVGDKMYTSTDEGVTWTQQALGLPTGYWSLATMRVSSTNYLLAANGGTNSYKWDGTTWDTIANIDANVKYLAVHNERLWAYASGATIRASKIGDFETWDSPDGLSLPIQTHDGDTEITGFFSAGSVLLVFKRNSTAYVDGFGDSDVIVGAGARGISRDVGCIAFRSIAAVGSGVVWLSERGFEFYQPGGEPQLISSSVESFMRDIAWGNIASTPGLPQGIFYPRKLTYECALPGAGSQNNYTFVWRIPTQGRPGAVSLLTHGSADGVTMYVDADGYLNIATDASRNQVRTEAGYLSIAPAGEPGLFVELDGDYLSLATVSYDPAVLFTADREGLNQMPVSIGYDGFVRLEDEGEQDDLTAAGTGGTDIDAPLVSRPLLFDDPFRRKHARMIRVMAKSEVSADLSLAIVADGVTGTAKTKTLPASSGDQPQRIKTRVSGRGNNIQVEIRASKAGLRIAAVGVDAEPLLES